MIKTAKKKNQAQLTSNIDLSGISDSSKYIKIGEASKIIGVSIDTLRRWEKKGWVKTVKTPGGTRLYDKTQLQKLNPNLKKGPKSLISPLLSSPIPPITQITPSPQSYQYPSISLSSDHSALSQSKTIDAEIVGQETFQKSGSLLEDKSLIDFVKNLKKGLLTVIVFVLTVTALTVPAFLLTHYINNTQTASNIYKGVHGDTLNEVTNFTRLITDIFSPEVSRKFFGTHPPGSLASLFGRSGPPGELSQKLNIDLSPALKRDSAYLSGADPLTLSTPSKPSILSSGSVLAESSPSGSFFQINLDTEINGTASVSGELTAPNIVYSITPGTNITVTGDPQKPTIYSTITVPTATTTVPGIASFSSSFFTVSTAGAVSLTDGGITTTQIKDGTITNSDLASSTITISPGSGMSGGGSASLGGSVTITNAGVISIAGTANQVIASGAVGAVTLTLPQDIDVAADVEFDSLELTTGLLLNGSTSGTVTLAGGTAITDYTLTLPTDDGTDNYVLTTNGAGVTAWEAIGGGACANCIITDPGATQTITPTAAGAIGLSIAQD